MAKKSKIDVDEKLPYHTRYRHKEKQGGNVVWAIGSRSVTPRLKPGACWKTSLADNIGEENQPYTAISAAV